MSKNLYKLLAQLPDRMAETLEIEFRTMIQEQINYIKLNPCQLSKDLRPCWRNNGDYICSACTDFSLQKIHEINKRIKKG
jgi:hypothetical protein